MISIAILITLQQSQIDFKYTKLIGYIYANAIANVSIPKSINIRTDIRSDKESERKISCPNFSRQCCDAEYAFK